MRQSIHNGLCGEFLHSYNPFLPLWDVLAGLPRHEKTARALLRALWLLAELLPEVC